jgi:hypothetical protein
VDAAVLTVSNSTGMDMTYDVSGKIDNAAMDPFVYSITLKDGMKAEFGGPNGVDITKGKMVKDTKVFKGGVQIASLIPVLDFSPIGASQVASLLAAADGVSNVFSFFDFGTPNFTELVANTDFIFSGFEGNRVPVLLEVATNTRITDSSGNLLPQFQFTSTTKVVGIAQSPIPEPSSLTLLAIGFPGLLGYGLQCQKRKRTRSGLALTHPA